MDRRDHDIEYRSLSELTLNGNISSPTPDRIQRQKQSKTRASLAKAEERFENLLLVFRSNPATFEA
jgi:hypothetical protein